ncbi:hypothetical protein PLESTB_001548400 [Pleodorina starrii]|uniref:Uncharacterized protein n=1 Tax=Pleodorina starrii TaxID=330485 RepID=A0A9W6F8N7_9CHLO|nr:hypothetical protein PLESTB_001548400 [Pleodorina starrii]
MSDSRNFVRGMATAPRILDNSQRLLRAGDDDGWTPLQMQLDRSLDRNAAQCPAPMEIPGLIPEAPTQTTPTRRPRRLENRQMSVEAFADPQQRAGNGRDPLERFGCDALMSRSASHNLRPRAKAPFLAWSEASDAPSSCPTDVKGSTAAGRLEPVVEQVSVFRFEEGAPVRRTAWADPEGEQPASVAMPFTSYHSVSPLPSLRRQQGAWEDTDAPPLQHNLCRFESSQQVWDGTDDDDDEVGAFFNSPMPFLETRGGAGDVEQDEPTPPRFLGQVTSLGGEETADEADGPYLPHLARVASPWSGVVGEGEIDEPAPSGHAHLRLESVGEGQDLEDVETDEPTHVQRLSPAPSVNRQGAGHEEASAPQIHMSRRPSTPAPADLKTASTTPRPSEGGEETSAPVFRRRPSTPAPAAFKKAASTTVRQTEGGEETSTPGFRRRPSTPAPAAFKKAASATARQTVGGDDSSAPGFRRRPSTPAPAAFKKAASTTARQTEGGDEPSSANMPPGCGALKPFKALCRAFKAVCRSK